jgi:hypothetical protein
MPYANLSDDLLDRLDEMGLDRDTMLLAVEGILYASRLLTDGHVKARLSKVSSSPDPEAAAERLVAAGVWERTEGGFRIVDYLVCNRPRVEVQRSQADARDRKRRSRLHKEGDHSLCIKGHYCPDGHVTRRVTRDMSRDETPSTPLLSTPLRKEVEVEKGERTDDQPDALTRSGLSVVQGDAHGFVDDGSGGCTQCSLPEANSRHRRESA